MELSQRHDDRYRALREEMLQLRLENGKTERLCVFVVVALFAWFLTQLTDPPLPPNAWLMPSAVVLLGFLRSAALFRRIGLMANYLRKMEQAVDADQELPGWESFSNPKGRMNADARSWLLFWLVLLAATVFFGYYCQAWNISLPPVDTTSI